MWTPFGVSDDALGKYPPAAAHSTSCFIRTCELAMILNHILVHMYEPLSQNSPEEMEECLYTQEAALQQWWDSLPSFLRLEPNNLPVIAPPSHIVTMK